MDRATQRIRKLPDPGPTLSPLPMGSDRPSCSSEASEGSQAERSQEAPGNLPAAVFSMGISPADAHVRLGEVINLLGA